MTHLTHRITRSGVLSFGLLAVLLAAAPARAEYPLLTVEGPGGAYGQVPTLRIEGGMPGLGCQLYSDEAFSAYVTLDGSGSAVVAGAPVYRPTSYSGYCYSSDLMETYSLEPVVVTPGEYPSPRLLGPGSVAFGSATALVIDGLAAGLYCQVDGPGYSASVWAPEPQAIALPPHEITDPMISVVTYSGYCWDVAANTFWLGSLDVTVTGIPLPSDPPPEESPVVVLPTETPEASPSPEEYVLIDQPLLEPLPPDFSETSERVPEGEAHDGPWGSAEESQPPVVFALPVMPGARDTGQPGIFLLRRVYDDDNRDGLAAALPVFYSLSGTAIAGEHFLPLEGRADFAPGQTDVLVEVIPLPPGQTPPSYPEGWEIELRVEPGEGYRAGPGALLALMQRAPANPPTVTLRNAAGNAAGQLRIAKWKDAYGDDVMRPDESPPTPDLRENFVDSEPDRFTVKVVDAAKAGQGTVSVSLTSVSGNAQYNCSKTIELTEDPTTPGEFVSKAQILVSDVVDDEFMPDETTRTCKIMLGGTALATYAPAVGTISAAAKVEQEKYFKLRLIVLRKKKKDDGGAAVASLDEARTVMRVARERFAQCGVGFRWTYGVFDPPTGVNLEDFVVDPFNGRRFGGLLIWGGYAQRLTSRTPAKAEEMEAEEKALLGDATLRGAADDELKLYVVNQIARHITYEFRGETKHMYSGMQGIAYPKGLFPDTYSNAAIVAGSVLVTDLPHVLAHEVGHLGSGDSEHSERITHLMWGRGLTRNDMLNSPGSRRLYDDSGGTTAAWCADFLRHPLAKTP